MGLHAQPQSPCLECAEVSEAQCPCKALNVANTGSRVLGLPERTWCKGRSFSVSPILLPTPGSWEDRCCAAHPFKSAWESPGPPSPVRARTSKRPPRDPVAEGGGRALGWWLRPAPFHPGWESTPREAALGFGVSLQARGGRTWGMQSSPELCDLRLPLPVSGPRLLQLLPP